MEDPKFRSVEGVPDDFPLQPKEPAEHGWERRPVVDFRHLSSLGHIAGNPFYHNEHLHDVDEDGDAAA